jgi:hypothetical protein
MPHSAGPAFQREARHCWPSPAAQRPSRPMPADAARVHDAVTTRWPCVVAWPMRLHQRPRCSVVGGVSTRMVRGGRRARRVLAWLTMGLGDDEVADGAARRRFFEGGGAPTSFGDGSGFQ